MHLNQFFTLIFLLFISTSGHSQEVTISNEIPESEYLIVGFWGSKLITYGTYETQELRIVDTASVETKARTFKIAPKVEKSARISAIRCFIQGDFMYEIYYVFSVIVAGSAEGYNMLVKRDLNTMEIVEQKVLEHLDTQVKFVKTTDNGFYICFGYSYYPYTTGLNYVTRSNYNQVIPTLIMGFDYDLEQLSSLNLNEYEVRTEPYLNELSFDENFNLTIPINQREVTDDASDVDWEQAKVVYLFTNLSGDLVKTKLFYDLGEKLSINSVKIRFDKASKKHVGIMMVNSFAETTDDSNLKFGYMYMEWNESGKLLRSKFVSLKREDVVTPELQKYAESVKLDLSKVSQFGLYSNVAFFGFLEDGSALYTANNISTESHKEITNSKFILCVSREGTVKWSLTLPYSSNPLYETAYFFLERNQFHVYTKEFTNNFSGEAYQYRDTKQPVNGESVVMTERVIDLDSGNIISHKPIIEQQFRKFDPTWPIHHTAEHEYLIRYRSPKANKDRWVRVKY